MFVQNASAFALICTLALAGCTRTSPPAPAPTPVAGDNTSSDGSAVTPNTLRVTDVQITTLRSLPPQILLNVTGEVSDACTDVDRVTQTRTGSEIVVTITTRREAEVCAQVIKRVTRDVLLEGSFQPGSYVVRVNGVERRFTI